MSYRIVAQGTSVEDLQATVSNMNLTKGTKIKVEMETGSDWMARVFDAYGAEALFASYVPSGCTMVDVHSDGTKGVVEMEADPVVVDDLIAGIIFWSAVIIVLGIVISLIIVSVESPGTVIGWGAVVLIALGALYIITTPGRSLPKWQAKS